METTDTNAFERIVVGVSEPAIIAAEARIRLAQLNGDIDALDTLISDELLFAGPNGELSTKEHDLAAHRSGFVQFRTHEPQELRIRLVGENVAIASLRAYLVVEVAGNIMSGTYRYTRVWARENGTPWQVVGGHVSAINSE